MASPSISYKNDKKTSWNKYFNEQRNKVSDVRNMTREVSIEDKYFEHGDWKIKEDNECIPGQLGIRKSLNFIGLKVKSKFHVGILRYRCHGWIVEEHGTFLKDQVILHGTG